MAQFQNLVISSLQTCPLSPTSSHFTAARSSGTCYTRKDLHTSGTQPQQLRVRRDMMPSESENNRKGTVCTRSRVPLGIAPKHRTPKTSSTAMIWPNCLSLPKIKIWCTTRFVSHLLSFVWFGGGHMKQGSKVRRLYMMPGIEQPSWVQSKWLNPCTSSPACCFPF